MEDLKLPAVELERKQFSWRDPSAIASHRGSESSAWEKQLVLGVWRVIPSGMWKRLRTRLDTRSLRQQTTQVALCARTCLTDQ